MYETNISFLTTWWRYFSGEILKCDFLEKLVARPIFRPSFYTGGGVKTILRDLPYCCNIPFVRFNVSIASGCLILLLWSPAASWWWPICILFLFHITSNFLICSCINYSALAYISRIWYKCDILKRAHFN